MTSLLTRPPDRAEQAPAPSAPDVAAAPVPSRPSAPARLALTGTLAAPDTSWLEARLQELAASGARTVEVDLTRVTTMDVAVARLLLRTSWRLGDPDRTLLLLHPRPQVRRVLRFVGAGGLVVR